MKDKIEKSINEGGLSKLTERSFRLLYRKIKIFLPYRYGKYNDVKVPSHKIFENKIDHVEKNRPYYEQGIVNSLESKVKKGDKVTILGGGLGVTTVKASRLCGDSGKVRTYEASKSQINRLKKTLKLNKVDNTKILHAIVGKDVDVWGSAEGAETLPPQNLAECDVLEIDIEGSEIEVIRNLTIRPEVIIVETHRPKGTPTEKVKKALKKLSYDIESIDVAEPNPKYINSGVEVITAIYDKDE